MTKHAEDVSNRSRITAQSWVSNKVKKYNLTEVKVSNDYVTLYS